MKTHNANAVQSSRFPFSFLLCFGAQMSLVVKSASLAKLTLVLEALHSLLFPLQWNGS